MQLTSLRMNGKVPTRLLLVIVLGIPTFTFSGNLQQLDLAGAMKLEKDRILQHSYALDSLGHMGVLNGK